MKPVLLFAPLHGIADCTFRRSWAAHFPGFDAFMAPFIATTRSTRVNRNHFRDLLPDENTGYDLIPQLLSNDAPGMIRTARILADLGYDELNWNLGCPFPRVTKKRRGSALLSEAGEIASILEQFCAESRMAISVKVRLGWTDPEDILRLMPVLNEFPLTGVIVHPRTGIQMYGGEVDLDAFGKAAELCRHKLTYNGDIRDLASFERLCSRFPAVSSWMIGRWAIRDPFLSARIKGLEIPAHQRERIGSFHDELFAGYTKRLYGPIHVLNKMKEIWFYLGTQLDISEADFSRLKRCGDLDSYRKLVAGIFAERI